MAAGGQRSLAEELRRVLAKLGGIPAVHATPPAAAPVHGPAMCEAQAGSVTTGVPAQVRAPDRPGSRAMGEQVARWEPASRHRSVDVETSAGAVASRLEEPDVLTGALAAVSRAHHVVVGDVPCRAVQGTLCGTRAHVGHRPVPAAPRAGAVGPLPRLRATGRRPRPDGPLFTVRRSRRDWAFLGRTRLALAWTSVLREHGLPAEELRLVGVYGPVSLSAVTGLSLDPGGRLLIRLGRSRLPGRAGDVVLARHQPTGRLLRTDLVAGDGAHRRSRHPR